MMWRHKPLRAVLRNVRWCRSRRQSEWRLRLQPVALNFLFVFQTLGHLCENTMFDFALFNHTHKTVLLHVRSELSRDGTIATMFTARNYGAAMVIHDRKVLVILEAGSFHGVN